MNVNVWEHLLYESSKSFPSQRNVWVYAGIMCFGICVYIINRRKCHNVQTLALATHKYAVYMCMMLYHYIITDRLAEITNVYYTGGKAVVDRDSEPVEFRQNL